MARDEDKQIDPDAIKGVALEDEEAASESETTNGYPQERVDQLFDELSRLQTDLGELQAEYDAEVARKDAAAVKAEMMKPYADKTFVFVCGYCLVALVLVVLQAYQIRGFYLPPMILTVITGSTAISVIGLVGIVVGGLFRSG